MSKLTACPPTELTGMRGSLSLPADAYSASLRSTPSRWLFKIIICDSLFMLILELISLFLIFPQFRQRIITADNNQNVAFAHNIITAGSNIDIRAVLNRDNIDTQTGTDTQLLN